MLAFGPGDGYLYIATEDGNGRDVKRISSFGEDGFGELYLIDYSDGELFRIDSGT